VSQIKDHVDCLLVHGALAWNACGIHFFFHASCEYKKDYSSSQRSENSKSVILRKMGNDE
jgi:hypothetical protein